jgi:hypothetical protein
MAVGIEGREENKKRNGNININCNHNWEVFG